MRTSFTLASTTAVLAAAAPFSYPLANGFPNLNSTALQTVFKLAGGTLPNVPLPTSLKQDAVQTLQLIAANELFETAYFTSLLANVTNHVPGYHVENYDYQETVHAIAANAVLGNANATQILPCQYTFPVSDFPSAILLAQTFTEVVLGVLPVAQAVFAADGGQAAGLVPIVGSIIAQEGQQDGYYRLLQRKVPASAPILTGGAPQFAFTAVAQFIVPGSCPNINVVGLTPFPALTLETTPEAMNSTQLFSVHGKVSASDVSMAYISGQNLPVTAPIQGVNYDAASGRSYFFAPLPYDSGFARGLTIGALVKGAGTKFNSTPAVAAATLNGPALIEID